MPDNTPQNGTQTNSSSESLTVEGGRDMFLADLFEGDGNDESPEANPQEVTDDSDAEGGEGEEPEATDGADESDEGSELEDPEQEEDSQPQSFTVTVDGKKEKVTLDELLKGYSRTADYTRKTQLTAAEKKAAADEAKSAREAREQHLTKVKEFEAALDTFGPKEPDWAKIREETPEDLPTIHAQWQIYQAERKKLADEKATLEKKSKDDADNEFKALIQRERQLAQEAIPEFKDKVKGKKLYDEMRDYAAAAGFTPEEFNGMFDHRALRIIADAVRFKRGETRRSALPQKEPVLRAGGKQQMSSGTKALLEANKRLNKEGTVEAGAAYFKELLRSK